MTEKRDHRDTYKQAFLDIPTSLAVFDQERLSIELNDHLVEELEQWKIKKGLFREKLAEQSRSAIVEQTSSTELDFTFKMQSIDLPTAFTILVKAKRSTWNPSLWICSLRFEKPSNTWIDADLYQLRDRLFNSLLPDFIVLSDPWCNIKYANRSYCDFFGYDIQHVEGINYLQNLPDDEREAYLARFRQLTPDQNSISNTHLIRGVDGSKQWTLWTEIVVFNEKGEMYEILSVGRNVKDLVELSEKNKENYSLLLDILTKLSHDIRPPICNLIALSDQHALMSDDILNQDWIQYFRTLVYQLDHLSIDLSNVINKKIEKL